jgi:hypothetical protein
MELFFKNCVFLEEMGESPLIAFKVLSFFNLLFIFNIFYSDTLNVDELSFLNFQQKKKTKKALHGIIFKKNCVFLEEMEESVLIEF